MWIFTLSKLLKISTFTLFVTLIFVILSMFALYRLAYKAPKTFNIPSSKNMSFALGNIRYETKQSKLNNNSKDHQILFLHGFNNHIKPKNLKWDKVDECAPGIRLDLPGFGESKWDTNDYTLPTQAERVIEFLDKLQVKKVTIQGGSMGGSLSAWIAANYPERVNAILIAAPSAYPDGLVYTGNRAYLVKDRMLTQYAYILAQTKIYKKLFPNSKALQSLSVGSSYGEPWKQALPKIKAPTVIMWSTGDKAVPFKYSGKVNNLIPNSILIPIAKKVGHNMTPRLKMITEITCKLFNNTSINEIAQKYPENKLH